MPPQREKVKVQVKEKKEATKVTMWGEQAIALRHINGPSPTDLILRAKALRAARMLWRGYKPSPKLLEALSRVASGQGAPRWAKRALTRLNGGLESGTDTSGK